jgi:hypothetical protein
MEGDSVEYYRTSTVLELHMSGNRVNQELHRFCSDLEYTSAYDGIGKGRLVG